MRWIDTGGPHMGVVDATNSHLKIYQKHTLKQGFDPVVQIDIGDCYKTDFLKNTRRCNTASCRLAGDNTF